MTGDDNREFKLVTLGARVCLSHSQSVCESQLSGDIRSDAAFSNDTGFHANHPICCYQPCHFSDQGNSFRSIALEPLCALIPPENILARRKHLTRHPVNLCAWSIVDEAVGKHARQRLLQLLGAGDRALLDTSFDGLDVERVLDERVVIRRVLFLDGGMEEVSVCMVGYLCEQHG